jgi:hypothetical protein
MPMTAAPFDTLKLPWFDIASAIFAFVAAFLWWLSARVKTPRQFVVISSSFVDDIAPIGGQISGVGSSPQLDELALALIRQSKLSAGAATCAGLAALCQAISITSRLISN